MLIALPNQQQSSRIGVVAGRAIGNAVQRNRAKRLMRAAVRFYLPAILPGWDIVLIARRPMTSTRFEQTQAALAVVLRKAHLLQEIHA